MLSDRSALRRRSLARLVAGFMLLFAQGCEDSLSPEDFYGIWGDGDGGARLSLSFTHLQFESSCWNGEIPLPLPVEGDGFEAVGTLTSQGGAGMSESRFATFVGRLSGDVLSLEVRPATLGLGPYVMRRDEPVEIPGCPSPAQLSPEPRNPR
ncbi:MAG TPA: hypothetical protein VF981_07880 [Gemmatimonadaceae bacterium]